MRTLVALMALTLTVGCSPSRPRSAANRSQLQTREFQTRAYDTQDTAMVMKALVNVLQDEGFIIKAVNNDIGVITAAKQQQSGREWDPHPLHFGWWPILRSWEASVNVSKFGRETKVRMNVQLTATNYETGQVWYVYDVDDPTYYRDFFAKVDKGVFIQKEKL